MAVCRRSLSEGGGWRTGGSGEDSVRDGSEMDNSEKSVKNHEKSSERHIYMPLYPIFDDFSRKLRIWEDSMSGAVRALPHRDMQYVHPWTYVPMRSPIHSELQ